MQITHFYQLNPSFRTKPMKRQNLVLFLESENNAMDRTKSMDISRKEELKDRLKYLIVNIREIEESTKTLIEFTKLTEKYIEQMVTKKKPLYLNRFSIDEDVEHFVLTKNELSSTMTKFEKSMLTMTEMNERITDKLKIYKGTISDFSDSI